MDAGRRHQLDLLRALTPVQRFRLAARLTAAVLAARKNRRAPAA